MTEAATQAKKKAPEVTSVTMEDGRVVEFAGKRKLLKESIKDEHGVPAVRFDFVNGKTRTVQITVGASDENKNGLLTELAQHGLKQKIGDEIAGLENIDDAILAVDDLIDDLKAGNFNKVRETNGLAGASVLLRALVEVTGKDAEQIRAFLKDRTAAEKKALRNSPEIAPVVAKIEAEKAKNSKAAEVDTGALLSQLAA